MQTIVITGASSGIGKATARYFFAQGWQVVATMRQPEQVTDLEEHERLRKLQLDVQDNGSIRDALQRAIHAFGRIDVLLNNAGYGAAGPLEAASAAQIRRQFDVNFFGLVEVIRTILPHFREQRQGLILNVSSIGGLVSFPLFSLYHASKWAVEGLTESLQYELQPLGIRLKLIEPGVVATDFAGRSLELFDSSGLRDYQPMLTRMLANFSTEGAGMANASSPEQIAAAIFAAATDASDQLRYVLGTDAQQVWQLRQQVPYEDFRTAIRQQMLG